MLPSYLSARFGGAYQFRQSDWVYQTAPNHPAVQSYRAASMLLVAQKSAPADIGAGALDRNGPIPTFRCSGHERQEWADRGHCLSREISLYPLR